MNSQGSRLTRISYRFLMLFTLLAAMNYAAAAQRRPHKPPSGPVKAPVRVIPTSRPTIPLIQGTYESAINVPSRNLLGKGTITFKGNGFLLKTNEGSTITGRFTTVRTGNYTAVALRLTEPVNYSQAVPGPPPTTLSLQLQPIDGGVQLTNAPGENTLFRTTLKCPDPPACNESDLCRPFCSLFSINRTRRGH